jgi:hypothetical protein
VFSALLLGLCQWRILGLNIHDRRFPFFSAEEISLLHYKIPSPKHLLAVVALHGLLKSEAVLGDAALLAVSVWVTAVCIAESIGAFVRCFFGQFRDLFVAIQCC